MTKTKFNVMFLCTGNSARSIIAESVLRKDGGGKFNAFSAGSQPKGEVNPLAIETLAGHNYPVEGLRSKGWEEFAGSDSPQWISSSPSVTARRGRPAPYGRAIRYQPTGVWRIQQRSRAQTPTGVSPSQPRSDT